MLNPAVLPHRDHRIGVMGAARGEVPLRDLARGAERRDLIEQAAARLFAERGYEDTSLEDVATAAGISRPVIYDHFATKRESTTRS